jgi:predicted acetyltransferase
MAVHAERPSASIEVIPATPDQEPILANLLELCAHDFSEFQEIELGVDGRFGYKHLPLYWREPNRRPFFIRADGKLAGFVLVKRGSEMSAKETVWDMAEFFVTRRHRRRGIGTYAAHEVWRNIPGLWEVRVMEANDSANRFWARAISAFAGKPSHSARAEKGGNPWCVYAFESKLVPQKGLLEAAPYRQG